MNDPLRRAEAQVQRFWNIDGLHEIAIALLFGLTAVWVWGSDLSDLPRAWKSFFSVTFPVVICGGMYAEKAIVTRIRQRLTFPRTGFVTFRRPSRRQQIVTGCLGAVVAAGVAFAATRGPIPDFSRWLVAIVGLFMGGILWSLAWRAQIRRFYALGLACAAAGIAISWAGASLSEQLVLFWIVVAVATLISGTATLWRFVHTPHPVEG
jgi:hypothetical protein